MAVRGGYEFYINEEWTGIRDAALGENVGFQATLMKTRFDPDDRHGGDETLKTLEAIYRRCLQQLCSAGDNTMNESGQLERIIIGEGPTAGKPISAVRIGEPSKELPFCAIPSIRWRDNGHTFVLETWFNGKWLEVPLVSTLPPPPNDQAHPLPPSQDSTAEKDDEAAVRVQRSCSAVIRAQVAALVWCHETKAAVKIYAVLFPPVHSFVWLLSKCVSAISSKSAIVRSRREIRSRESVTCASTVERNLSASVGTRPNPVGNISAT